MDTVSDISFGTENGIPGFSENLTLGDGATSTQAEWNTVYKEFVPKTLNNIAQQARPVLPLQATAATAFPIFYMTSQLAGSNTPHSPFDAASQG